MAVPRRAEGQAGAVLHGHLPAPGRGRLDHRAGGGSPTALLAFFGPDVPAPRRMREAPAVLRQTGEKPQKAQVYNAAMPDSAGYGMAIFATPSAKAALDGMLDRASFEIAMGKGPVVAVEWTGGAAARAWLRKCIGKGASG